MSRESRAFFSTAVFTGFGYAGHLLTFFAIPLYLRTLGTEGYGLMVTVAAFMGYLNLADAGLSWGAIVLIAHAAGRQSKTEIALIVRHSIVLAFGSGILVLLVLIGLVSFAKSGHRLPMFSAHPGADVLLIIAGLQLFMTLQFSSVYGLFQGLQETYWTGLYQGLARILGLAGGMIIAAMTGSVAWVMAWQAGMTTLLGVAATVHAVRVHPWAFARGNWFDKAQYLIQLRVGLKNFLIQVGRTLSCTAPTLAISSIAGPAMVPFFTVPLTLLGLFFMPANSWNASMQGAYGEAWTAGERTWVKEAFRSSLLRVLIVAGLGFALFFALGDDFVRLWTQDRLSVEFSMAGSVAAILLTGALLTAGQYLLVGLNHHGQISLAEMGNGVLALGLVIFFVKWLGVAGVGVGVTLAALLTSAWVLRHSLVVQLGSGFLPKGVAVIKIVTGTAAGWATARLVMASVVLWGGKTTAIALGLATFAGAVVFVGFMWALRVLPPEVFSAAVRSIRRRFAFLH